MRQSLAWCTMSRRTKNSLASLSEADVQRFVLESPATYEDQDTTKKGDFKVEKTRSETETTSPTTSTVIALKHPLTKTVSIYLTLKRTIT